MTAPEASCLTSGMGNTTSALKALAELRLIYTSGVFIILYQAQCKASWRRRDLKNDWEFCPQGVYNLMVVEGRIRQVLKEL